MNRDLAIAEWRRAQTALRAAQILINADCPEDAVSRAYYAVLHAAKAALYVHDVAVTSHTGARRLFSLHLVRPGAIEAEWASYLGESADDRVAADYDPSVWVSPEEAVEDVHRSRRFLSRIRTYLLANGLREQELQRRIH